MSQVEKLTNKMPEDAAVAARPTGSRFPGDCHQHHIRVAVSRPAFYDNITYLRESAAPSKVCVVLKANAYGHGLTPLVPVAVAAGADYLGICTNPEAAAIRALGFDVPIFRLRMGLPEELDQSADELNIEEQVGTLEAAEYMAALGRKRGSRHSGTHQDRRRHGTQRILRRRGIAHSPGMRHAGFEDRRHSVPLRQLRCGRSQPDAREPRRVRATVRSPGGLVARGRADPYPQQCGHGSLARAASRHGARRGSLLWRAHFAGLRKPSRNCVR